MRPLMRVRIPGLMGCFCKRSLPLCRANMLWISLPLVTRIAFTSLERQFFGDWFHQDKRSLIASAHIVIVSPVMLTSPEIQERPRLSGAWPKRMGAAGSSPSTPAGATSSAKSLSLDEYGSLGAAGIWEEVVDTFSLRAATGDVPFARPVSMAGSRTALLASPAAASAPPSPGASWAKAVGEEGLSAALALAFAAWRTALSSLLTSLTPPSTVLDSEPVCMKDGA
mmetsp:Transcript_21257/g.45175  ORF Transcript_21257/g.45175 Transcript_21257/m.45175 type:complete len:225 (+) Transcript_21257:1039-1713(+)